MVRADQVIEFERGHSMHGEHAVTLRLSRSVASEAPRAQLVDNRLCDPSAKPSTETGQLQDGWRLSVLAYRLADFGDIKIYR